MPNISERAIRMPASPIRKLVPLADAAKRRGVKIYHLNIGQPDLTTPQEGLDALSKIDRKLLEYSPSDGFLSLREKLVGYYDQYHFCKAFKKATGASPSAYRIEVADK